ncbi:CRISPR-associated endonuclease Cas2 [Candidatus Wolfebacteria bacterium CG03_land_8_20_14_0_80_36_15]|uniref:CRISPR-associated endonuclease Cas2 n=1 Tax=Candidatus Wolfebacteria bacterium CG03_land_8_20_14_0_80_36_15 TaxID=1975067 RepID=A0A2M7B7F3_9BACT|nr:MAG: CRISPR-associated endonuclease Cas2 [Candidatus Wolfebacteria bacterium CG03_land_8_20_14_0_80_36_15]
MRKGDISLKILEFIGSLVIGAGDLLVTFLNANYGASFRKLEYELSKRQKERDRKSPQEEIQREAKQKYYNLIYKLKRSGLIKEKTKEGNKFFSLTQKGKIKLSQLKKNSRERLPEIIYQKAKSNKFTIVIFDIPETEKRKRSWLRVALGNLGFKMIQKSVWLGKVKIPKRFLDNLFQFKLVDFVEIFEISKTGSLKQIT